jgi:ATP-dependent DNA helicase DinG
MFVPAANVPVPNGGVRDEHTRYVTDVMKQLVLSAGGGAFLLFTSYGSMRRVAVELTSTFERNGIACYLQGDLPKMELIARFRANGNAVLFATKSFWEGVDVQGAALRLVVIDKLPFEAPNPLNQAQEESLRRYAESELGYTGNKLQWYPFEALRVPKMIIDLKQGVGRLIRTSTDRGVIAILDPRIRTTQYGRNCVLPSLPPAPVTSTLSEVVRFLEVECGAQLA